MIIIYGFRWTKQWKQLVRGFRQSKQAVFISCKIYKTSFRQPPKDGTHRRQPSNYDSLQMTHLTRESSPISVYLFCFSVQSFLFLQKCPWLLPMIHYLWLIQRFPAMVSPQVPDCCLHTLVLTNQSESWLNEIGTIQSKPSIQRV